MITIKTLQEKKPTDSDLRHLYDSNHWTAYTQTITDLTALLTHAHHVYTAWDNNTLVGLIRTISDGIYVVVIQDILVLPNYQRQGIGKQLLQRVLNETQNFRQVFLLTGSEEANEGVKNFYRQQGLTEFTNCSTTGFLRTP